MTILLRILFLVATVSMLGLLADADLPELARGVVSIGFWAFAIILGQEVLAFLANAAGWWLSFPAWAKPPFLRLLSLRVVGDAVNYATPSAGMGGELVRLQRIAGNVGGPVAAASVTAAKVGQSLAHALYASIGLAVGAAALDLGHPDVTRGLRIGLLLLWMGTIAFLILQRTVSLEKALGGFFRDPSRRAFFAEVDDALASFHARPLRLVFATILFTLGWATGVIEVWAVNRALDLGMSWQAMIAADGLMALVEAVLFFMPSKLLAVEGGAAAAFEAAGVGASTGLTFGLARRFRQIFWTLFGLALWPLDHRAFGDGK